MIQTCRIDCKIAKMYRLDFFSSSEFFWLVLSSQ